MEYVRNNSYYYFDSVVDWSNSSLAIQQGMGIRSHRWARSYINHHYHFTFIRKNIRQEMNIFRLIGIAAFVVGVIFFVFGIRATQKTNEEIVEKVSGHYTDKTTLYIIGGVILIIFGGGLTMMKRR